MRVLLSSCFHWWNAEAAYAAVLGEVLAQAGHQVTVWTQPGTRNEEHLRARGLNLVTDITPGTGSPLRWPRTVHALRALHRRERFDVVNVFRSAEFPLHLLAARGAGGPPVVRTRGNAAPVSNHWLNRRLYGRWSAGVITPAEVARRALQDSLGLPPDHLRTIYYPVELQPLPTDAERRAGRELLLKELGLASGTVLLGIVGRIAPEKGHALLLEALGALLPRFPATALLVFGKSYPGEDAGLPALQARAKEKGLAERVRWLGFREDIRRVMGYLAVGVIPSVASEINCRVAVEFFAAGTPVVAYPTGALPEVVEDGVSGVVARERSPEALAEVLAPLLAEPNLRERLGLGARRRAEERFSQSLFLRESLAAFENALAGRPVGSFPNTG